MRLAPSLLSLFLCLALAACGGGRVAGIPGQFGDDKPHSWRGGAPDNYPVHGTDVSRWQGSIDWPRVRSSGIQFAWIKATEGGDHTDPNFAANWRAARRAGVPRGAYHFYYLCRPAVEQARWFIANVPRERGALPPALDIEWNHQSRTCRSRPDPAALRAEIKTFQRIVAAHYGTRPVIYTTVDFWRDNDLSRLGREQFWLRSVAGHPREVYPGHAWTFWQYTGTGRIPGIRGQADLNAFAGSQEDWARWLARSRQ